jgi:flagellar hook-associated protein 2
MSTISSGVGLISGLPISDLVDSLMAIQQRPLTLLQNRLGTLVSRRTALIRISAQLLSIQNLSSRFTEAESFNRTQATSTSESVLLATTGSGAALGQFTFTVRNLATMHQVISAGFSTQDASLVGAGTLTLESASGLVDRPTLLGALNGGAGVRAGRIAITDRAGNTAEIDLRTAFTIDDVVSEINAQNLADVTARIEGDHLVLEDQTSLSSGDLVVSEVAGGHTAEDLGLLVDPVDGVITGDGLVLLSDVTRLEDLNDGNGVRKLKARKDFEVTLADGTALQYDLSGRLHIEYRDNGDGSFTDLSTPLSVLNRGAGAELGTIRVTNKAGDQVEIDLSSAQTIRDVTTASEWEALNLDVAVSGSHLVITDNSTGSGSTVVEDVDSTTAQALGIARSSSGDKLTGDDIFFIETIGDVTRIINSHVDNDDGGGGLKLVASISAAGPRLTLTDATSGGGRFKVDTLNGSRAAIDLGIVGNVNGDTIESRRLFAGLNTTLLRSLAGGRGVSQRLTLDTALSDLHRGAGVPTGQIRITTRDGGMHDIDLTGATTIGDVKTAIESSSTDLTVALDGAHLVITDNSTGEDSMVIEDIDSATADALGIAGSTSEASLTGRDIYANIGDIQLTDRSGASATVDLSGAETLADLIDAINSAPTAITASVSSSGLGFELVDTSGGAGPFVVEDLLGSTTAADLGIAFSGAESTVSSGNLQRQYVSAATLLTAFGNGGVPAGRFTITDSRGASARVDLTQGNEVTLQDAIDEINTRGIGVTARINDTGDGLLLEDTAGGTMQLTVTEEGGTTARALGILGTAAEGETFIDGSLETRIAISSSDTLADVLDKVQDSGARVNATIINDGTGARPYRLNLISSVSGRDGALAIDVGTTGLEFSTLTEARDATVLFGSPDAEAPLVLTSSTNTLSDAIPGVRLDLVGSSDEPVTITIAQDVDAIVTDLSGFVNAFNNAIGAIDDLTRYDSETETRSVLTGDATARRVRQRLINMVNRVINGLPPTMNRLSNVGITLTGGASLTFDEETFREALQNDPDGVMELFTREPSDGEGGVGFGGAISDEIEHLVETDTGVIPIQQQAIQASERLLNDRIDQLAVLLGRRRERLFAEFNALELVISRLQAQQAALAGISALSIG